MTILSDYLAQMVGSGRDAECWPYPGHKSPTTGYGRGHLDGRTAECHRLAYEAIRGPVPKGLQLDHLCRNRPCCNPWHLEAVTTRENLLRGEGLPAKEAKQTHCLRGHPFAGANLYYDSAGKRGCIKCRTRRASEYYERRGRMLGGHRSRGEVARACRHGHVRTPANTWYNAKGSPMCADCHREQKRRWYEAHRPPSRRARRVSAKMSSH